MKKIFFIFWLQGLFAVHFSYGQIRSVPSSVTEALHAKYPNSSHIAWKDKITSFLATFELDNKKYEARFDSEGNWLSTESEINDTLLPGGVRDGLDKSKYADWAIRSVYSIDLPGDRVEYRILVAKNDLQRKNLFYSPDGRLIRDNITLSK